MGYIYYGTTSLIKTEETITVLPSGLIQKKLTVVGRKTSFLNSESQIQPLSESVSKAQLGTEFFPFPTISSGVDLNNGFIKYDIVGYKKGSGSINSVINYKYRKISSFIIQDQFRPQTEDISVEVGVRSTIVVSDGVLTETQNEEGETFFIRTYESPQTYSGELFAYNTNGSRFIELKVTEIYRYTDPVVIVTTEVAYRPVVIVESVSSNYYGHYTEYITTSSLKIERVVLSQTTETE